MDWELQTSENLLGFGSPQPKLKDYWQKPEDVHEAGCLVITDGVNTPQRCMICYSDGTVEPILYDGNGKATLSAEERSRILEARGATNAVLISEADPGISAFSGTADLIVILYLLKAFFGRRRSSNGCLSWLLPYMIFNSGNHRSHHSHHRPSNHHRGPRSG